MKKISIFFLVLVCACGVSLNAKERAQSAQQQAAASDDKTPPSYDMKAQALFDLQDLQKKYVELAQAIPADKYTWRPEAGTRSVSELFLHVSAANYNIPTLMAGTTPAPRYRPG